MATPLDFYKIPTMEFGIAKSYQAQKYYAGGGYNLVWPVRFHGWRQNDARVRSVLTPLGVRRWGVFGPKGPNLGSW